MHRNDAKKQIIELIRLYDYYAERAEHESKHYENGVHVRYNPSGSFPREFELPEGVSVYHMDAIRCRDTADRLREALIAIDQTDQAVSNAQNSERPTAQQRLETYNRLRESGVPMDEALEMSERPDVSTEAAEQG